MFLDAHNVESGRTLEADLCIIGSGAAGLTVARALAGTSLKVCLLESGGLDPDAKTQDLYDAELTGVPYFMPLRACRQRYFGGSTNCWTGWCRPLDPIDFEKRDGVPHSGWPFDREHLDPWYAQAQKVCGLNAYTYEAESWAGKDAQPLPMDPTRVVSGVFQLSAPARFGTIYRAEINAAANVEVLLHATVKELVTTPEGERLDHLEVATLAGSTFYVKARATVLAAGGIENARLLLLSDRTHTSGLCNEHDLVGRYFMEHPHLYRFGTVFVTPPKNDRGAFYRLRPVGKQCSVIGTLIIAPEELRRRKLLNFTATLEHFTSHEVRAAAKEDEVYRDIVQSLPLPWQRARRGPPGYMAHLNSRFEQAPNPESRVTLVDKRDALGQRKARLHWALTDTDYRTATEALQLLGREFGFTDTGRLRLDENHYRPETWTFAGGPHHMGTTRMHSDPKQGVVDRNCKSHALSNLYIAGSSVFPTGGSANPTLTIVAMALRLADHLEGTLA